MGSLLTCCVALEICFSRWFPYLYIKRGGQDDLWTSFSFNVLWIHVLFTKAQADPPFLGWSSGVACVRSIWKDTNTAPGRSHRAPGLTEVPAHYLCPWSLQSESTQAPGQMAASASLGDVVLCLCLWGALDVNSWGLHCQDLTRACLYHAFQTWDNPSSHFGLMDWSTDSAWGGRKSRPWARSQTFWVWGPPLWSWANQSTFPSARENTKSPSRWLWGPPEKMTELNDKL